MNSAPEPITPTPKIPPAAPAITVAPATPIVSPAAPVVPVPPPPPSVSTPKAGPTVKPVTRYIPKDTFRGLDFGATLQRIGFGSCANQDQPEPLWKTIEQNRPDLFLFMGDNIYASSPDQKPIADQYRKLDLIPEYKSIRMKVPFMAIWDDGDLGTNDGGADAPTKEEAKTAFLNYWTYVKNSLPLEQINRGGLYHSKMIGPKNKVVQIIMLDTRYYRSPLHKVANPDPVNRVLYEPSKNSKDTLLGEQQWRWLESQLRRPANLRLIVSSIQLVAKDHQIENWNNFPHERQRFFDLLRRTGARNVVVLSGDRHIGTVAKTDIKGWGTLYDLTASSINRPKDIREQDSSYVGSVLSGENFGMALVDWNRSIARIELLNADGKAENSVEIKLRK